MRVLALSDLHLEFDGDMGRSFLMTLDPQDIDVVVLAGDITMEMFLNETMSNICRRFPDAIVIKVKGNHELYRSSLDDYRSKMLKLEQEHKNLRWLDNTWTEVNGVRFLGTTLWFKDDPLNQLWESSMNDFHLIKDFRHWVYQENQKSVDFIRKETRPGDVVITHHLPLEQSVAPMFKGGELNRFFLCDMSKEMAELEPRLWVHGHTHTSFDYRVQYGNSMGTRVVCNPRGYHPMSLNPDFKRDFVVELDTKDVVKDIH